jgi:predicted dehydrogenase
MRRPLDRRRFLQAASFAGFGIWLPRGVAQEAGRSPNERLAFACIGAGGKGSSDTDHVAALGDVVALCDIDAQRLGKKADEVSGAKTYQDFRKLFDELASKIDAVVVSTPDHSHAFAAITAMRLGKPVYCQKPLTHSCREARLMRETAAAKKVATQMGNQGSSHPGFRKGIDLIRSGKIGAVREVYVWTNRPFKYWKQAPDVVARPAETPPVPEHVAWDLWLGPAPERPYHPIYHPHDWRGWWDFGTGALGDMACHTTNLPYMALKLGLPTRVSAESGEVNPETYPAWATIVYEFPARGDLPPVKLTWYEGAKDGHRHLPPTELFRGHEPSDSGSLLVGESGAIFSPSDYGAEQIVLGEKGPAEEKPPARLDEEKVKVKVKRERPNHDQMHKTEWVRAIREGDPSIAWSNFDYASRLTETMLLGNVAVRVGKPIEYDGATGRVTNCPEAAKYLQPEYRKGWEL